MVFKLTNMILENTRYSSSNQGISQDASKKKGKDLKEKEESDKDSWEIENFIYDQLKKYIIENNNITDNEIYMVMDFDNDGNISIEDFRKFVLNKLKISEKEFNKFKLERLVQRISLTKNTNLSLFDIKE